MKTARLFAAMSLLTIALSVNGEEYKLPEVVFGKVIAEGNQLTVNVASSGCTSKGNFRWDVVKVPVIGEVNHHTLTLVQVRRDECKAMLWEGIDLTYDLTSELGIQGHDTYSLTNKISVKVE